MTKAELVEKMSKDASISKVAAAAALDSFMDGITKALKKKEKLTLARQVLAEVRRGNAGWVWYISENPP